MKKKIALTSLLALSLILTILVIPLPTYAAAENHLYWVMGGLMNSAGRLGGNPPWNLSGWQIGDGVPFASRAPDFMPWLSAQNISFDDKDSTTGIVYFTVPKETYVGLDHKWWSFDTNKWFRAQIFLQDDDGCGWIFTGEGTSPILGSVDLLTYGNASGVYTYGFDGTHHTADDELLAGEVAGGGSAGAGPPIGPCLQNLRGTDNIPGTADDPIGRGDPNGPNPAASSIMYLPSTMVVTWYESITEQWKTLFSSPWPLLMTTGNASCTVMDPTNSLIDGATSTRTGHAWEFISGEDSGTPVVYGHPKWNAYVTYVTVWSVLFTASDLGTVEVLYEVVEKKVRDDCVIADINCDEVCNIIDIVMAALAFDAEDENFELDKKTADPNYDARGDIAPTRGKVNIVDIVKIALDFDEKLEP